MPTLTDNVTPPPRVFAQFPEYDPRQRTSFCGYLRCAVDRDLYATGGPTLFALGGAILIGVIVFIIGYGLRSGLIFDRRRPSRI